MRVAVMMAIVFPLYAAAEPVVDQASLRAAIAANPGRVVEMPAIDIVLDAPLVLGNGTGLAGRGRLIQQNPEADIVRVEGSAGTQLCGLTLMRAQDKAETHQSAIRATDCSELFVDGVQVVDNWSNAGTILLEKCRGSRIVNCSVVNYKRIAVDDRTGNELYGYAFRVIDGTGILLTSCRDCQVAGNRVIEKRLFATKETKEAHHLGDLCEGAKPTKKGQLAPQGEYANNWHQGSAIVVTSPEETDHIQVANNLIENAAQGIDLHADHVTCSANHIDHAFIGIKCMHGARNVIISGNNVSHMDLWGIVMMPGTASHPAEAAAGDKPARGPNYTHGNIIANNVFSDYGFGYEYFNWEGSRAGVIMLDSGQLRENPVMTDVLIQGNVVYDSGKDQVLVDGQPQTVGPRYEYAVKIATEPRPEGLVFVGNILHAGRSGVSNVPLEP